MRLPVLALPAALILAAAALAAPAAAQETSPGASAAAPPFAETFGKTLVIVYSVTGSTLDLAGKIQALTGGDLVRIETEETYPVGEELIPYAKRQRDELRKPVLKGAPPDVSSYDTVFLGSPVWFHELPPAVTELLAVLDFQRKPLAPFLTAGGSAGDSAEQLRTLAKTALIREPLVVFRYMSRPGEEIDKEVEDWLKSLRDGPAIEPPSDAPADANAGAPESPPQAPAPASGAPKAPAAEATAPAAPEAPAPAQ
ncbi:MAG: hypothetical protein LBW85_11700 [Deltaproteobacteria bacterium]|jgi:flavodoxin|nr:hypothetical protein [Deltaproteobacteria bacterium]